MHSSDSSTQRHQHWSNSLESGVIGGRHQQGCGKRAWSKAGGIRGSDQVNRVVTCLGRAVIIGCMW